MQYAFYFDQNRCTGCDTCTVACKDWNSVKPGPVRWRKKTDTEEGTFPDVKTSHFVYSCNHCNSPACLDACPFKAIYKDKSTGMVLVDQSKCQGAGDCVKKCPYGAVQMADDKQEKPYSKNPTIKHTAQKCTMCWDRLEVNQPPVCIMACPTRALDFGTTETILRKYPKAVRAIDVKGFPKDTVSSDGTTLKRPTSPNLFINPKY